MDTQQELHQRRQRAVMNCEHTINWYEDAKTRHRRMYQTLQTIAIVLGASTPIVILATHAKLASAIVAGLAVIATGLNGTFQLKESYVRFAYTSEALKTEKLKFETTAYKSADDENKAIENFVDKIRRIAMTETSEWRKQQDTPAKSDQPPLTK